MLGSSNALNCLSYLQTLTLVSSKALNALWYLQKKTFARKWIPTNCRQCGPRFQQSMSRGFCTPPRQQNSQRETVQRLLQVHKKHKSCSGLVQVHAGQLALLATPFCFKASECLFGVAAISRVYSRGPPPLFSSSSSRVKTLHGWVSSLLTRGLSCSGNICVTNICVTSSTRAKTNLSSLDVLVYLSREKWKGPMPNICALGVMDGLQLKFGEQKNPRKSIKW